MLTKVIRMKYILVVVFVIILSALTLAYTISLRGQLSDCRFECNGLQTKIYRLEELSDVVEAMNQVLPPLALAQLKAVTLMIRNERYKAFEGIEQPLLID